MYTEEDRRIATDILMELKRTHLVEESDMYDRMNHYYKIPRDSFGFEKKCCFLWREMESMGLIQNRNKRMSLTTEGHLAAKLGITNYLLKYEKDRELDIKSKESTVWHNRLSVANIICGAIGFLIGWIAKYLI